MKQLFISYCSNILLLMTIRYILLQKHSMSGPPENVSLFVSQNYFRSNECLNGHFNFHSFHHHGLTVDRKISGFEHLLTDRYNPQFWSPYLDISYITKGPIFLHHRRTISTSSSVVYCSCCRLKRELIELIQGLVVEGWPLLVKMLGIFRVDFTQWSVTTH